MENETLKPVDILGDLIALRREVNSRIENAIEAITPFQPREYLPLLSNVEVPADSVAVIAFGVDYKVPGTEIPGLPELTQTAQGVEHPFICEYLVVNDSDAEHFEIENVFLGIQAAWPFSGVSVPAARFAESAARIKMRDNQLAAGLQVSLRVHNKTNQSHTFRARIIGRERVVPNTGN